MAADWLPHGVLDWGLLAYVVLGAWAGFRRGFLFAAGSLAAYAAALATAGRYGGAVLGAADRAWGLSAQLSSRLPAAAAGGSTAIVDRALGWAAFAAVFLVAHLLFGGVVKLALGRARPGSANAWMGLAFGALERALLAAVVLAVAVSLARLPPLHVLAGMIDGSNWARDLLGWLHLLPAPLGRWTVLL